ncbi:MAG: DUF5916 domain-containing protein [Bacteroidota bacterium]|nr:DUF5916 domain-containing protein [Bacteroidota bacterium]
MKFLASLLIAFIFITNSFAQVRKSVEAMRISTPLIIDGVLDEDVYKQVQPAKDFLQIQPYNGKPANQPTEVYFFYDESAIYVGAMLHDKPDSIFNFLTARDNTGMSDYFGLYIDPYNQGQLAYGFFLTPAGVQMDLKAIKGDDDVEDPNWNAVWESKARITDKGWSLEMRIPFSELRFSEKAANAWGVNIFRNLRRYNSNNSWNFLDRNVSGFIHQEGQLTGIKDIKPSVRLSLTPYLATYFQPKNATTSSSFLYKGGMDLKYGINDAFTLDMMLVPDFGQIQSDDKKLNLTPYELYYSEKRQFFNEGTELFQRANIFYSRRIGASPLFTADNALVPNEIIKYNPSETQLVNATKISGRTASGWGIGVLNALSLASDAILKDTLSGNTRKVEVQPLTNYNVMVVDKSLKNNSYISLINTNVYMYNNPFRANVTATEFQFRDKSKTYALKGKGAISMRGDSTLDTGYYGFLQLLKNKGKLQYGVSQNLYSDKYNPNDLGYLQRNNQLTTESYIYYQKVEPFWIIREYNGNIWWDYIRMYNPSTIFGNQAGYNANVTLKNNYALNINGVLSTKLHDHYEPRVPGKYFISPGFNVYNINLNTDNRKALSFYFHYGHTNYPGTDELGDFGDAQSTLRVGQRFEFDYSFSFNNTTNGKGFVDKNSANDSIIFAKRNVHSLENIFTTSYILSNKASLSFRLRHYWSGAMNKAYYLLQPNGSLVDNSSYTQNKDQNYNAFSVDMIFTWNFAPGSELDCAWKNTSLSDQSSYVNNYWLNLHDSWLNQLNSLSVKILYYIDFNKLKKKKAN